MRNLIELLHNTVAFMFAMRIIIVIALAIIASKVVYTFLQSSETKKFWSERKKHIHKHRGILRDRHHKAF